MDCLGDLSYTGIPVQNIFRYPVCVIRDGRSNGGRKWFFFPVFRINPDLRPTIFFFFYCFKNTGAHSTLPKSDVSCRIWCGCGWLGGDLKSA